MKTKKKKQVRWDDTMYLQSYLFAQEGLNNRKISELFGVNENTYCKWVKERPALRHALKEARGSVKKGTITFREYVINRLPKRLRRLWDKINECSEHPNGLRRTEALFRKNGEDARKHLFLHALTSSMYDFNEACEKTGIKYSTYKKWCRDDLTFADMLSEIEEQKDNFFESALIRKANEGDSQAIALIARSRLKHRGYGEVSEVKVTGGLTHTHTHLVDISKLNLSIKTLRHVYKAMQEQGKDNVPLENSNQTLQIPFKKG